MIKTDRSAFAALIVAAVIVVVTLCSSVEAQDCTPTYVVRSTHWSSDPSSHVIPDSNNAHVFSDLVPTGQVWKMRSISLSTMYGGSAEYMLEWLVTVPGGNHYHEIARGSAAGTPALHVATADAALMIMQPGERLAGRVNGDAWSFPGIALYFSAWAFPSACLPRLLGVEASGSTAPGPQPDYTAFVAALGQAATALQSVAQSVP